FNSLAANIKRRHVNTGDAAYNQFLNPSITGIHMPALDIGRKAVELIIDQIEEKSPIEEKKIIMPVKLKIGQTCIKKER
ncbi:MAG: substrate-binding domain-containing protein, partial [Salinibacter sp.]